MTPVLEHRPLGRAGYDETLDLQRSLRARIQADPRSAPDVLLTVEHPPVLTAGRRAKEEHLLRERDALARDGVAVRDVERGGDWTWHGPGQLVAYPIVSLRRRRIGVKDFVAALEEAMLEVAVRALTAAGADPEGARLHRRCEAPGAWVEHSGGGGKIGAVGVHVGRGVTLHGLALNVDPDPWGFDWIVPCGLADASVTSLARVARALGGDPTRLPALPVLGEWLAADLSARLTGATSAPG